jgi:hypothetical protein
MLQGETADRLQKAVRREESAKARLLGTHQGEELLAAAQELAEAHVEVKDARKVALEELGHDG